MNRRKFLRNSSFAGAAVGTINILSCTTKRQTPAETEGMAEKSAAPEEFVLNETGIDTLQKKMEEGTFTSRFITERYLERIEKIDRNGPSINSVIELNPDALAIADEMDRERKQGKIRGKLHGIPVLIKDNINTGDKMMTTAGSLALVGNIAEHDAFIIQKLRAAGAVLLGKTNLSEWANFRSSRSTSGWSSRGGQTRNPYILDRNPSGSSSGSGVAVSANLCAVAIGTETDGSIIAPSAFCGIVGMKPTVGLWSRSGIIPISKTQDTAGPMGRSVKDIAILLGPLSGTDPNDPATAQSDQKKIQDYTIYLDENGLSGKKIGIEKSFLKGHEGVVSVYREAMGVIKNKGAEIVELDFLDAFKNMGGAEYTVFQYEFKDGLNRYLQGAKTSMKSLSDIIAFNRQQEKKAMPFFKQEILESCENLGDLNTKDYQDALKRNLSSRNIIDEILKNHHLHAIAGTSIGLPCCIDLANGDYDTGFYFCPPAARSGYPHITVPMGHIYGLPLGLSFIAGAWQEPQLISIAYAFEQATLKRVAPSFAASLP